MSIPAISFKTIDDYPTTKALGLARELQQSCIENSLSYKKIGSISSKIDKLALATRDTLLGQRFIELKAVLKKLTPDVKIQAKAPDDHITGHIQEICTKLLGRSLWEHLPNPHIAQIAEMLNWPDFCQSIRVNKAYNRILSDEMFLSRYISSFNTHRSYSFFREDMPDRNPSFPGIKLKQLAALIASLPENHRPTKLRFPLHFPDLLNDILSINSNRLILSFLFRQCKFTSINLSTGYFFTDNDIDNLKGDRLISVKLGQAIITDQQLISLIEGSPNLAAISYAPQKVEAFAILSQLKNLTDLDFCYLKFFGEVDFGPFADSLKILLPQLTKLKMHRWSPRPTNDQWQNIFNQQLNLKYLDVSSPSLDDTGVLSLVKYCPVLEELDLHLSQITDLSLAYISEFNRKLKSLNIYGCEQLTPSGIANLIHTLPAISEIYIGDNSIIALVRELGPFEKKIKYSSDIYNIENKKEEKVQKKKAFSFWSCFKL